MVSFREVRQADPGAFDGIAQQWARLAAELDTKAGDIGTALTAADSWSGGAADTARGHVDGLRAEYRGSAEQVERIPPVLRALADRVTGVQQQIESAAATANSSHLVRMDGETGNVQVNPGVRPEEQAAAQALAAELNQVITGAVAEAGAADQEAASALRSAMPNGGGVQLAAADGAQAPALPAADARPADVKQWWDSLSQEERQQAIAADPERIGRLDGIPVDVRDQVNRSRLDGQLAELIAQRDELNQQQGSGDRPDPTYAERFNEVQGKINGIEAINERLDRQPTEAVPRAYLLGVDTEGDGQAIVSLGNPDTADYVVTSVPGVGSGLESMNGELGKSEAILGMTHRQSPGSEVAAINWVGYDAPDNVFPAGTREDFADQAVGDLHRFSDGLRVTHQGEASFNTAIGHSYGSTAIGHTLRDTELPIDRAVFVGSPGVGVNNVADLRIPAENVYASTAANDIIRGTPPGIHGPQPVGDGFGATVFPSDPGTRGSIFTGGYSTAAHSEYWNRDSASLRNMGLIVTGREPN